MYLRPVPLREQKHARFKSFGQTLLHVAAGAPEKSHVHCISVRFGASADFNAALNGEAAHSTSRTRGAGARIQFLCSSR